MQVLTYDSSAPETVTCHVSELSDRGHQIMLKSSGSCANFSWDDQTVSNIIKPLSYLNEPSLAVVAVILGRDQPLVLG